MDFMNSWNKSTMNFNDRDRMIEKYLGGRMSHVEEREFLHRLDSDGNLRKTVEAERSIRQALLRDRDRIPADDPALRANVMGMLATLAPAGEPTGAAAAAESAPGVAAHGSSLFSGGLIKGVVVAITGMALTVGTLLMIPRAGEPTKSVTRGNVASQASGPAVTPAPAVSTSAPTQAGVQAAAQPAAQPAPAASLIPARQSTHHRMPSAGDAISYGKRGDAGNVASLPDSTAPKVRPTPTAPVVLTSDTMRVNVTIDLGKLK
jgi:hypothetical protein